MDISDSLSTNNSELDDTMGSILSTSNENETQHEENDLSANITSDEPSLINQNIEVNELQNTIQSEILPDTTLDNVESYTETLSEQDINLIIMGKPSTSDDSDEIISSSVKNNLLDVPSTSHIEEHEELWLGDNTRQLVKVDTDEDFEVIVKSLETAIVETERYDIDTVITSNDEPVMSLVTSSLENSLGISLIEPDSDSLLEDIPSNLLTSSVPPLPLQELQGAIRVDMSDRILQSPVERPISQHLNSDNYDEFATISEPKVESFDEQSSSLFDVMEPEIDIPIENEPSLLELQEATMPADISEFQQDIEIREDLIYSSSANVVETITSKVDEMDEICEASVDSEFAENQFIKEQIESDIFNDECSEKTEEPLKKVTEKLDDVENLTERKNEITIVTFSKIDTPENETQSNNEAPDSDNNLINIKTSQLENIFEINVDTNNFKDNIITSPQLEIKPDANDDTANIKATNLIVPERSLESISTIDVETENLSNSSINVENQLEQELNVNVKVDTKLSEEQERDDKSESDKSEQSDIQENVQDLQIYKKSSSAISEKQKYIESNEREKNVTESDIVQENQDEFPLDENKTNIESKNISSDESTDKPEETNDIKISLKVVNKSEITESLQANIKEKEDKLDETLLMKKIQKENVSLEEIQKELLPLKDTSTSSSVSIKHKLDDEKEQSPPKKIKLVREKFQRKPVHIESQQLPKNIETSVESEIKMMKREEIISSKIENEIITLEKTIEIDPKTIPAPKQKSVVEGKETIQQILQKLEDPLEKSSNENRSPVKAQKLKLQRNYKLPQKSVKQKVTTKILEEPITLSMKKEVVEEIKITNILQDKSVIFKKEETEKISQPSFSKTKVTALETKISGVSIELNEPAISKDETKSKVETKSTEPVQKIEIEYSVPTCEISVSADNAKIIDAVSETTQNTLFSMQQDIPKIIEEKNPINNQINVEVQETNIVDVSKDMKHSAEEKSEAENKDLDIQMVPQLKQKEDCSQTLINMETQFTELKTVESNLPKNDILIIKAGSEEEEITNIGNESIEFKNQQHDLMEIKIVEKKEKSCIENEMLDSQNLIQETTQSDDNISEHMSIIETQKESSGIETMPEKQNIAILKNIETMTSVATVPIAETTDMIETVIDENVEKPMNIDMSSENIKEREISEEAEQFFSSNNAESNVENITEVEIASIQTITKNISDTINVEEKIEIEKQLDSVKVEMKIDNKDTKHAAVQLDTKNIKEKIEIQKNFDAQEGEMKIENTKHAEAEIETKNKEEKNLLEKNFDIQEVEMKEENIKLAEAKIDTENKDEKNEIEKNFDIQEVEMKKENTKHAEAKIDTETKEEKNEIEKNFDTQEVEMKKENTKNTEAKFNTKNKGKKNEIEKNVDTLEVEMKIEHTEDAEAKIETKNKEEKNEIEKNIDKQEVEMKIEKTNYVVAKIDTENKEKKNEIEKNVDTQDVEMKTKHTKDAEAKIETKNKEEKNEIEKDIDKQEVEMQIENTNYVIAKIDTRNKEKKNEIERNVDTQDFEIKIEQTKDAEAKIATKNKEEKYEIEKNIDKQEAEMKIESTTHAEPKIDTKNKENKNEIERNVEAQHIEIKIEHIKDAEAKIATKNKEDKNEIEKNIDKQEVEMKIESTTHAEAKIDTKNKEKKNEIEKFFDTQDVEMKIKNIKRAEAQIETKNKEKKIEIEKNFDTQKVEMKIKNTKHAKSKMETKNNEEKTEIGKFVDVQKFEMKIENRDISDTKHTEAKFETLNIVDTQAEQTTETKNIVKKVEMKTGNKKHAKAKIDTKDKEEKIEIVNIFHTQIDEMKKENTRHAETKIDTKNKEEKIEMNFDTQKVEMKIKNTKLAETKIETKNKEEKTEIENFVDIQKFKMKIDNRDISVTKHTEAKFETLNIVDTQAEQTTGIKSIVNIEKPKEKINTYETELKLESYGTKSEPKNDKLLTFNTQFPLLSSRLQERLEPKSRKFTQDIKITPITFPTVSQESVSKKIQEQLNENKLITGNISISKPDLLSARIPELSKTEATAILAKNPAITLTKEIASSRTDHLATMESATKIKITKRKLDASGSEPSLKRSVTKPLSVQIDDLENSNTFMERSHSSGTSGQREQESIPKFVIKTISKSEGRASPKITIKPIKPPEETSHKSRSSEESSHSPKITIKPIVKQDPLKMTITKQKADDTHSILKIYQPDDSHDHHIPKLTIKPISKSEEMQHSPRITIKPVKPSPSTSSMSPKITVKPIPSPSEQVEIIHSPKVTVKPVVNPEESYPKVTIKPVLRPEESHKVSQLSPRQMKLKSMSFESSSGVTVEPICGAGNLLSPQKFHPESQTSPLKISVKPFAKMEESLSPKLTIKPITKTCEIVQSEDGTSNPLKLTIKPILKPEETSYQSPKITIKPIVKPDEMNQQGGEELDKPERIILKIQKTSLPSPKERLKDTKKEPEIKIEAIPHDPEKNQRLDKIKLKLTKEGSHAQIIPSISTISDGSFSLKRSLGLSDSCVFEKRSKTEYPGTEILHTSDISINIVEPNAKPCPKTISEEVTIMKIDKVAGGSRAPTSEHQISQSKFKEMLMKIQQKPDITCTPHMEAEPDYSSSSDDVKIVEIMESDPLKDPLSINDESSSQDVMIVNEVINTNPFQTIQIISAQSTTDSNLQTPKKRGRPRKNPLEVKPEIKGEDCVEVRPKRTCRAPPGRTPFAIKERKPRGAGRGRGSRGRGASKSPQKSPKEVKTPRGKALKEAKALAKIEAARLAQEVVIDEITIEDSTNDTPAATPVPPVEDSPKKPEVKESEPPPQMVEPEVKVSISEELPKQPPPPAVYEEETRMSADNSRAQTPARQVFTAPLVEGPEESQSSVQSTATTESTKTKKGRLEVCDPDSAVTTVDQIVEYSWANGGPYMLQEQIAQYLGVKSFKRKYPGLTRRPVEMQERDYIRGKGLVSESMCDMGLTAVPSSEILDIMYSDFQEKYEEYRKCLRDKQAKEISNKQKAVSLATSQEKNKIDFKERAIRSAANWNVNFNKARKETRKCCMDLQTFTINYPAGKKKVPYKPPVGHYPIALVPGQYTDYYKSYTTNDLHYLPLNTVRYGPVLPNQRCDAGQSDGSQSDSDSSSGSDSDSSDDSMSTEEETPTTIICKPATVQLTQLITTPKSKVH